MTSNSSAALRTFQTDAHYVFRRTYASILGYFATRGDIDGLRYNTGAPVSGSINGSPTARASSPR